MIRAHRFIHPTAIVGCAPRYLQGSIPWKLNKITNRVKLPRALYIGPYAIIGFQAKLHERVVVDAYCKIDPLAEFGEDSVLIYRGTIGVSAKIGNGCIIGGSVSENTFVGDRSRSFGKLIHTHTD